MLDLLKESLLLGTIGSVSATTAIFVFQILRRCI